MISGGVCQQTRQKEECNVTLLGSLVKGLSVLNVHPLDAFSDDLSLKYTDPLWSFAQSLKDMRILSIDRLGETPTLSFAFKAHQDCNIKKALIADMDHIMMSIPSTLDDEYDRHLREQAMK